MICQFTSDTLVKAKNTRYNKSATELSVGFLIITPHHYDTDSLAADRKNQVQSFRTRVAVKIIVFSTFTRPVLSLPDEATIFVFP